MRIYYRREYLLNDVNLPKSKVRFELLSEQKVNFINFTLCLVIGEISCASSWIFNRPNNEKFENVFSIYVYTYPYKKMYAWNKKKIWATAQTFGAQQVSKSGKYVCIYIVAYIVSV